MAYHLPVNRILANALRSPSYGLNVQLGLLVTDGLILPGDTVPTAFETGAIADEGEDPNVAVGDFPDFEQAIGIGQVGQIEFPGELFILTGMRTADNFLSLLRYRDAQVNAEQAARNWFYVARAVLRCFRQLTRQEHESDRKLAQIGIISFDSFSFLARFQIREGLVATGGIIPKMTVRDLKP